MAEVTQRDLEKIRTDIHNLRDRFSLMLSCRGGYVEGQIDLDGWLQLHEDSAPSQPATDKGRLYAKSDGLIYWQDDGGTEHDLTSGGGGPGAPSNAQYLALGLHADLSAERRFVAGTGLSAIDDGPNGDYTLSLDASEISHDDLLDVSADDHHNRLHALNSASDHSASGLSVGQVLRATGATTFAWAELQHDDLGGVTADQHHNQVHVITGADHTVTGSQWQIVGLTGTDTLGLLTPSTNPGAAAAILRTDGSGYLTLQRLKAVALDDAGAGHVDIRAHLIPYLTDTHDLGSSTKLWRKGWLSEMDAVLFAENTITLLGGWFYVTKYAGTAQEDIDNSETQIDLGASDAVMAQNDFIVFRQSLQVEYMQLGSYVGANVWNVTRNVDGSGANTWPQGAPFACFGYDGDGRIELNAYDTPRMSIIRHGTTYNTQTELIRLGDLNGLADYSSEAYGIFIGDYAGDDWMAYDPAKGLRVHGNALIDGARLGNPSEAKRLR